MPILLPVARGERYHYLDVLRGMALFGVLLINLLYMFRISLFQHMLHFHSDPGALNHMVDVGAAAFVSFKALTLFSLLFGAGSAIRLRRSPLMRSLVELSAVVSTSLRHNRATAGWQPPAGGHAVDERS